MNSWIETGDEISDNLHIYNDNIRYLAVLEGCTSVAIEVW